MSKINWAILKNSDPKVAWSLVSKEISDQFFAGTLLTVPTLEDASYFDLMVCFSRINSNIVSKITMSKPEFRLHGHFLDIAADKHVLESLGNPLKEDLNLTSYSYKWTDRNSKSITIKMEGMKKYVMNWNLDGRRLVLDSEKVDLRKENVYVISEVVYADKIIVEVQISNSANVLQIENQIPVAFSYMKFPVDKNGVLLPAQDTKIKLDAVFEPVLR